MELDLKNQGLRFIIQWIVVMMTLFIIINVVEKWQTANQFILWLGALTCLVKFVKLTLAARRSNGLNWFSVWFPANCKSTKIVKNMTSISKCYTAPVVQKFKKTSEVSSKISITKVHSAIKFLALNFIIPHIILQQKSRGN